MMLRAVARVVLPLTFVATLCLPGIGQTSSPAQTTDGSTAKGASTLGSSTSLDADSNDVASLYGTPAVQIIARVNDRVITNSDLKRAQDQLAQESRQANWTLDQYNDSEKNLLRDLIDQQLLLSKGKQIGITGDTELIKRLDDIRKQNHMDSMDDLEKAVEGQGTSYEDFKANIRNSIITQQVVRQEVGEKMQMSQAEIEKYYNEHRDSFTQQESIHLNEILIPTDKDATSDQLAAADARAQEVETKLKAGGNFADLAKKYSGGPTAQQGGDLGEFKRGALAKVLEDQTFDLPVGGYTGPIRTRQGYIILQVTAHNPGGAPSMQKVEPQIEQTLYMQQIQPAVRSYLTRLRNEAYIDIRPGYTDAGASPNETKPTFAAYAPPQPKKKKLKKRFDKRVAKYGRISDRKRKTAIASETAAPTASSSTATAAASAEKSGTPARFKRIWRKTPIAHKNKRVKIRYGRAPETPVSAEQVATAGSSSDQTAAPAAASETQSAVASGEVQPLGPDLEHTPIITQPKKQKRRLSDEARNKSRKIRRHEKKVKAAKKDNAAPTSLTPAEAANQKVDSAPLGLAGDTVHKKKKKKIKVRNGEKTRLSNQKKEEKKKDKGGDSTTPSSSDNSNPPPAAANPS